MKKKTPKRTLFKRACKKLDTLWSAYIRKKFPACIMCGTRDGLNAHHCIERKSKGMGVRWSRFNGVSLCYVDHILRLHGQQADKAWLERYIQTVDRLIPQADQEAVREAAKGITKLDLGQLEAMIAFYEGE